MAESRPGLSVTPARDDGTMINAPRFAETAKIVGEVARMGSLQVPAFRSPPRRSDIDRSITRRPSGSVVAVRRRGRPPVAVQSDLIEGVVVVNDLDPSEAARFRSQAWAALVAIGVAAVSANAEQSIASAVVGEPRESTGEPAEESENAAVVAEETAEVVPTSNRRSRRIADVIPLNEPVNADTATAA